MGSSHIQTFLYPFLLQSSKLESLEFPSEAWMLGPLPITGPIPWLLLVLTPPFKRGLIFAGWPLNLSPAHRDLGE